ncbi:MAG: PA2779 family protein [Deltaproteobacteria bacterium]|nr:PA2779 family protein [Deltaproteobacteria bacterium]
MKIFLKRMIVWYLVVAMFIVGTTPKVFAGFSPSEVVGLSQMDRAADLWKIQKIIETKMIRERLKEFGLTPEEIQTRLNQLSDQQIHQLALKLDELKVGGDAVAIVIIVFLVAVIVVLLIYATGHRIVIK